MRALWPMVLAVCACEAARPGPPKAPDVQCNRVIDDGSSVIDTRIPATAGYPWTAAFQGIFHNCDGSPLDPHPPVEVEVLDPLDVKVPFDLDVQEAGDGPLTNQKVFLANVTFTPQTLGSYHLAVRFEPDVGSVQTEVSVAEDRRPSAFMTLPMPYACEEMAFEGSLMLCLAQHVLHVFSGGVETGSLYANAFALSDGYLWFIDDGAGVPVLELDQLSAAGARAPLVTQSLDPLDIASGQFHLATVVASGRRAAIVAPPFFQEVWFDGRLHFEPELREPLSAPLAVDWVPDAGAIIGGALELDAGVSLAKTCVLQLSDGGLACEPIIALGFDGRSFWSAGILTITSWALTAEGGLKKQTTPITDSEELFAPLDVNGKWVGPVGHHMEPYGVELYSSEPEPHLVIYGAPPVANPATWGVTADWYWETYFDGTMELLAR